MKELFDVNEIARDLNKLGWVLSTQSPMFEYRNVAGDLFPGSHVARAEHLRGDVLTATEDNLGLAIWRVRELVLAHEAKRAEK